MLYPFTGAKIPIDHLDNCSTLRKLNQRIRIWRQRNPIRKYAVLKMRKQWYFILHIALK